MTERDMELCLYDLLSGVSAADLEDASVDIPDGIADIDRVSTYPEVGMLTGNAGLVVRMKDGSEFQITIVKSR